MVAVTAVPICCSWTANVYAHSSPAPIQLICMRCPSIITHPLQSLLLCPMLIANRCVEFPVLALPDSATTRLSVCSCVAVWFSTFSHAPSNVTASSVNVNTFSLRFDFDVNSLLFRRQKYKLFKYHQSPHIVNMNPS